MNPLGDVECISADGAIKHHLFDTRSENSRLYEVIYNLQLELERIVGASKYGKVAVAVLAPWIYRSLQPKFRKYLRKTNRVRQKRHPL
ncbi:MAG: hypothetical protein WAM14_24750 [Candidatus Nitrosopolaris sp.]